MSNKIDSRIIKTKEALYNALIELLKETSFENIKVSDICVKANIHRSTFYIHYKDKSELLIEFFNKIENNIFIKVNANKNNIHNLFIKYFEIILNQIENNKNLYYLIYINNQSEKFINIFVETVTENIIKQVNNEHKIFIDFYVGAFINIIINYLKNNYSKKEIQKHLNIYVSSVII